MMQSATHSSTARDMAPAEPVEQEMQTARVHSKPGWDDSVLLRGTPRTSSPRAVHLPVRTAKRTNSTPGARRLSAWRNAKVGSCCLPAHDSESARGRCTELLPSQPIAC